MISCVADHGTRRPAQASTRDRAGERPNQRPARPAAVPAHLAALARVQLTPWPGSHTRQPWHLDRRTWTTIAAYTAARTPGAKSGQE